MSSVRSTRTRFRQFSPCFANSHRQNDAKLCLAAHHARVSLARFFERICFNHRTHAGQFGEVQCVLGIGWRSRRPALNRSTSSNELYRRDLNGIECRTDHHELAVRPQTVDQLGHRFRAWGRRQNHLCAAQFLAMPPPRSSICCRCTRSLRVFLRAPRFRTRARSPRPYNQTCSRIESRDGPDRRYPAPQPGRRGAHRCAAAHCR